MTVAENSPSDCGAAARAQTDRRRSRGAGRTAATDPVAGTRRTLSRTTVGRQKQRSRGARAGDDPACAAGRTSVRSTPRCASSSPLAAQRTNRRPDDAVRPHDRREALELADRVSGCATADRAGRSPIRSIRRRHRLRVRFIVAATRSTARCARTIRQRRRRGAIPRRRHRDVPVVASCAA